MKHNNNNNKFVKEGVQRSNRRPTGNINNSDVRMINETLELLNLIGPTKKEQHDTTANNKYLQRFQKSFDRMDIDQSHYITHDELLEALDLKQTKFTQNLFELMDIDGSGTIEFCEYVTLSSLYCIYTKHDILSFCFHSFDIDGNGTIDEWEFRELIKTVNPDSSPMFPGNYQMALKSLNESGIVDSVCGMNFRQFVLLDKKYPQLLFPAFRLQEELQQFTLGAKLWNKINVKIAKAAVRAQQLEYGYGSTQKGAFSFRFQSLMGFLLCRAKSSTTNNGLINYQDIIEFKEKYSILHNDHYKRKIKERKKYNNYTMATMRRRASI